MKRLEIQTLRQAGMLVEDVAAHADVSPRSVQRVAKEDPISDPVAVDDAASRRRSMTRFDDFANKHPNTVSRGSKGCRASSVSTTLAKCGCAIAMAVVSASSSSRPC